MSHLLYFTSFSPDKFRDFFVSPTKDGLRHFFDLDDDIPGGFSSVDLQDMKTLVQHILDHGLTYQGLDEAKARQLDEFFRFVVFSDEAFADLDKRPESDGGAHITTFEALLGWK